MLVDCPRCEAKVDAEELSHLDGVSKEHDFAWRVVFLKCPSCGEALLASQINEGFGWESTYRLYPPQRQISYKFPNAIRRSYEEAVQCLQFGCLIATVIMCRRTLEQVCRHYDPDFSNLSASLKKLHDDKVIDDRLSEWAEALRKDGNLAAHEPDVPIGREDAKDLVDFTEAILDYVFVLQDRFEAFKKRRAEREAKSKRKGVGGLSVGT